MRRLLIALSLLIAVPASAADISMTLNDEEQRVLREILDVATKAGGLSAAPATLHFATKLENLRRQAGQPPAAPPAPASGQ